MPSAVDAGGKVGFEKEIAGEKMGIQGQIDGWIAGTEKFNIEGSASLNGPGFHEGGEAVLSSVGVAACRDGWGPDVGAGYKWGGEAKWFASSCGLDDYREVRPSVAARARGTLDTSRAITVAPDLPVAVFAVQGDSAPPKISVAGPSGEAVSTPAGPEAVSTPRFFVMQAPGDRTTYVAVEKPSAGAWQIRTLPGSAEITGVRRADGLPPVSVAGAVTGAGAARTLSWTMGAIAGQEVTFVAEGGGARQIVGTTSATSGTLDFAPEPGAGGRRVVRAYVTQDGLPREDLEIASFDVADAMLSPPGGLTLARRAGAASMVDGAWTELAGATGYRATVEISDGRRLVRDLAPGERAVAVPGVGPGAVVTLEVAARMPSGSFGPSAVARLGDTGTPPAAAIAPPERITTGERAELVASATAGSDAVASIAWELDGDGLYDDASGATASRTFATPGMHPVSVRVTDAAGRVVTAAQTVVVDSLVPEASIAFDGRAPLAGEFAAFTGTDSDSDGSVLTREWDLDGDGQFDDAQGAAASTAFAAAGTHTIRYRVVDDSGRSSTASKDVDVAANRAPVLDATVAPGTVEIGETVRMTATASDPDDRGLEAIAWDLDGDGSFTDATGAGAERVYARSGTVTVRARVADVGGAVTTVERVVTVRAATATPDPGTGAGGGSGATPDPGAGAGGGGATPPVAKPPLGGLTVAKSVRRAALLKTGLPVTFTAVRTGAKLDATLRFVPKKGRAVTLGRLRTTAKRDGRLATRIALTKAGKKALRRGLRGRLELKTVARQGTVAPVTLTRKLAYKP